MDKWNGKVAIVTGASAGIGAAIAERLAKEGLVVVGLARRLERLEELKKKLESEKGSFHPVQCDMTKENDILKAFEYAKQLGPIHVLINNAGIQRAGNLADQPSEKWQEILNVNVVGLSIATREAVQDMEKNNVDGFIIHMNSIAGKEIIKRKGMSAYSASKFAVTALAGTMRDEIAAMKNNIRITSIYPGLVMTEFFDVSGIEDGPQNNKELPVLYPEDIVEGVIYVLSTPPHVNVTDLTIRPANYKLH